MSPTVHRFDVRKKADDSGGVTHDAINPSPLPSPPPVSNTPQTSPRKVSPMRKISGLIPLPSPSSQQRKVAVHQKKPRSKLGNLEESEDSGGESSSVDSFFALGELLISLCYNPSDQKLNVKIISARGLQPIANGTVNPFVKLDVTFCGRKLSSRSTKTEHHTLAPNFCELFVIDMKPEKLNQVTLIFKVKHHGRMRDVCIGTVHLGYCVHVEGEYRHWEQSMEKPHMEIEYWHPIQEQFVD
ncbi:synaptotagmin-7-like isoform X4 [Montipora capricornis]|uniref:synaptotagmin-7-like isoform X3 n=1 Tax=Montipora capricornis TaxID=246305 RepID=UPI0035F12012